MQKRGWQQREHVRHHQPVQLPVLGGGGGAVVQGRGSSHLSPRLDSAFFRPAAPRALAHLGPLPAGPLASTAQHAASATQHFNSCECQPPDSTPSSALPVPTDPPRPPRSQDLHAHARQAPNIVTAPAGSHPQGSEVQALGLGTPPPRPAPLALLSSGATAPGTRRGGRRRGRGRVEGLRPAIPIHAECELPCCLQWMPARPPARPAALQLGPAVSTPRAAQHSAARPAGQQPPLTFFLLLSRPSSASPPSRSGICREGPGTVREER